MSRDWMATGPGRLALLAALLIVVSIGLSTLPIRTEVVPRLPVLTDAVATGGSSGRSPDSVDAWQSVVVTTNLFSTSRRAPSDRFRMPGLAVGAEALLPPPDASLGNTPIATDAVEPVLLGLVRVNGARQALIGFSSPDSVSRLVGVGGRIGAYRVRLIGPTQVELQSAVGPRTLRLPQPSPSDSSEWLP
jgi:hypothetical protein